MHLRAIALLCLSIVHPFFCYEETNERDDSILKYLKMDPNNVLQHEIVKIDLPERLHKREIAGETEVTVQALGMDLNLLLRPADERLATDHLEVYYADYRPRGRRSVTYRRIPNAMENVGRLLEDPRHSASVVLQLDNFRRIRSINGYLKPKGHNASVVIRSLPAHVVSGYLRKRRAIEEKDVDEIAKYHLVAKVVEKDARGESFKELYKALPQRRKNPGNNDISGRPAKRLPKPETLRPQILVEVDFCFHEDISKKGLTAFLEYLLAFWNGVDMVFRNIEYPKIRINIAAVVISRHARATPYIFNNMLEEDAFHYNKAIEESASFHFDTREVFPFEMYDFAVTMTKFQMGLQAGVYNTVGIAYVLGACDVRPADKRNEGVSLVRDNGVFSGILTASHEIGHLLGFLHDDMVQEGHRCVPKTGFNMAAFMPATSDASWFSECSLETLRTNYEAGNYQCMYNEPPSSGEELPHLMPGKLIPLEKQCEAFGSHKPCTFIVEDICHRLWCETLEDPGSCFSSGAGAAPGTPCGDENDVVKKVCLKSRCVEV